MGWLVWIVLVAMGWNLCLSCFELVVVCRWAVAINFFSSVAVDHLPWFGCCRSVAGGCDDVCPSV